MTTATTTATVPATSGMKIEILSKTQKTASLLADAIRILAWEQFKVNYKQELRDSQLPFGGYDLFDKEWQKQPYINMNLEELTEFVLSLGYSLNGLLNYRIQYYARKAAYAEKKNQGQNQASLRSAEAGQPALPGTAAETPAETPANYANEEF